LRQYKLEREGDKITCKIHEIYEAGYQEGIEPASAEIFAGNGLVQPSPEKIEQFFWEGD
jgi:hypothetical protein